MLMYRFEHAAFKVSVCKFYVQYIKGSTFIKFLSLPLSLYYCTIHLSRALQIFQKLRSHLKILGAIRVISSKFHPTDPQKLNANIKPLCARTNWHPQFVQPSLKGICMCSIYYTCCKAQQFLYCSQKQQTEMATHLNLQFPYCVAISVCQAHDCNCNIAIACCGFTRSWFTMRKIRFTLRSTLLPQLCDHHNGGRVFSPNHGPKVRHCVWQRSLSCNISSLFSIIALETSIPNYVKLICTSF